MQTLHSDVGYAIWCSRGVCSKCNFKGCECPHHIGGEPDIELVANCKENAVARGWMGAKCQMAKHTYCKKVGCACKCHSTGAEGVTKIIKEEAPIASEEHVKELQDRIYAVSSDFGNYKEELVEVMEQQVGTIAATKQIIETSIQGFDQRLKTMEKAKKLEIHMPVPDKPGKTKKVAELGMVHKDFEELLHDVTLQTKGAVYLVGGAGGGKTFIARQIHLAMGRKADLYFPMSVGLQTTKADLLGYTSPTTGECYHSPLYNTHVLGGTGLLDEVDAANAGVLTVSNSVLASGPGDLVQFGCKCPPMPRHPDARFIVAANTFGKGADHLYVGRNQLDEATRKRFIFFPLDYDWDLVRRFTGDVDGFTTYVERLSECAAELRLRVVISPRQAEFGCARLAAGQPRERVEYKVLWADMDVDDHRKILEVYKRKYPDVPKVKCRYCGNAQEMLQAELDTHMATYHPFPCGQCGSAFSNEEDFNDPFSHVCKQEGAPEQGSPLAEMAEVDEIAPAVPICPNCSSDMTDNSKFNAKQKAKGAKPIPQFKCTACNHHTWPEDYVWGSSKGQPGHWKED